MIVSIDGWWGSGKSLLRGLLDGHPQVFASPVHEISHLSFMHDSDNSDWVRYRDTEQLRKLLAHPGRYYRIERFAANGRFQIDFSSTERTYIPFDFDFYKFDQAVLTEVRQLSTWTINSISETIYSNFCRGWANSPGHPMPSVFASMGEPIDAHFNTFRNNFPDGKLIYVDRGTANVIATRAARRAIPEDFRSAKGYANDFGDLMRSGEVERIEDMRKRIRNLQRAWPETFLIVEFEELLASTEEVMRRVANFLGIDFKPELKIFSFGGAEVILNGRRYLDQEFDDPSTLLSPGQREEVQRRILRWKKAGLAGKTRSLISRLTK